MALNLSSDAAGAAARDAAGSKRQAAPFVGVAVHKADQRWQAAFIEAMAKAGIADLTFRQFHLLWDVGAHPSGSQTDSVERTGMDRSTLAEMTRRLVKRGLLARRRTKEDARAYAVKLTDKGRALVDKVTPIVMALNDSVGKDILREIPRSARS